MRKFITALCILAVICFGLATSVGGCSEHKRTNITNVAAVDSGTIASIPSNLTIIINKPQPYEYHLIRDILWELRNYEAGEGQSVDITIVIEKNFVFNGDVNIENNKIVIRPNKRGFIPLRLYHYLCKLNKKKCKKYLCGNHPKPCDNE